MPALAPVAFFRAANRWCIQPELVRLRFVVDRPDTVRVHPPGRSRVRLVRRSFNEGVSLIEWRFIRRSSKSAVAILRKLKSDCQIISLLTEIRIPINLSTYTNRSLSNCPLSNNSGSLCLYLIDGNTVPGTDTSMPVLLSKTSKLQSILFP